MSVIFDVFGAFVSVHVDGLAAGIVAGAGLVYMAARALVGAGESGE